MAAGGKEVAGLSAYVLVMLISLFVYSTLFVAMLRDRRNWMRRTFSIYLGISIIWSLSSFMLVSDVLGQTRLWGGMMLLSGSSVMVAYYHFVSALVEERGGTPVKIGYGVIGVVLLPLVALGYIPHSISAAGGVVNIEYGSFLGLISSVGGTFFILSVVRLVKRYRALTDRAGRNQVIYLLAGLALLMAFAARSAVPPTPVYPLEHIGHLANSVLIAYAITRHKLLDIKLVLRKGLVYSSVSVFVTAAFLLLLLALQNVVQSWTSAAGIVTVLAMAFGMSWLLNPMRMFVQKGVDRLFYGETYEYRELVLSLPRGAGGGDAQADSEGRGCHARQPAAGEQRGVPFGIWGGVGGWRGDGTSEVAKG